MSLDHKVIRIELPTPFPIGPVNLFLLRADKLTLIDAGMKTKEAWNVFEEALRKEGYKVTDIEQVILTHQHPDHTGFLEWLPSDIPVYGHKLVEPWIYQDEEFVQQHNELYRNFLMEFGVSDDVMDTWLRKATAAIQVYSPKGQKLAGYLKEGDTLPYASDWEVIETPGHSLSQLMFYNRKEKVAFGGDHILPKVPSNPYLEPTIQNPKPTPLLDYLASLEKTLNYDIDLIYSGHGEPLSDIHSLIMERIQKQHKWALRVLQAMGEGKKTTLEVSAAFFPDMYEKAPDFIFSEVYGQLTYLEKEGYVELTKNEEGVLLWETTRVLAPQS